MLISLFVHPNRSKKKKKNATTTTTTTPATTNINSLATYHFHANRDSCSTAFPTSNCVSYLPTTATTMKYIHEWETQQNAAPSESNFQMNGCNEQNITEANQHFTKAYIGLEW